MGDPWDDQSGQQSGGVATAPPPPALAQPAAPASQSPQSAKPDPWQTESARGAYDDAVKSGKNVLPAASNLEAAGGFNEDHSTVKLSDVDVTQPNASWADAPSQIAGLADQFRAANPGQALPEALQGTISQRAEAARSAAMQQLRLQGPPEWDGLSDADVMKDHQDRTEQEAKAVAESYVQYQLQKNGGVSQKLSDDDLLKIAKGDPMLMAGAFKKTAVSENYQTAVAKKQQRSLIGAPLEGDTPQELAWEDAAIDAYKQNVAQGVASDLGPGNALGTHFASMYTLGIFPALVSWLEKHVIGGKQEYGVPNLDDLMAAQEQSHPYASAMGTGADSPRPARSPACSAGSSDRSARRFPRRWAAGWRPERGSWRRLAARPSRRRRRRRRRMPRGSRCGRPPEPWFGLAWPAWPGKRFRAASKCPCSARP